MTRMCNAGHCRAPKSPTGLEFDACPVWFADVVDGTDKFAARVEAVHNAADRYGVEVIADCCKHPSGPLVRSLVAEDSEAIYAARRGSQAPGTPLHDTLYSLADGASVRTALAIMTQNSPSTCAAHGGGCGGCVA